MREDSLEERFLAMLLRLPVELGQYVAHPAGPAYRPLPHNHVRRVDYSLPHRRFIGFLARLDSASHRMPPSRPCRFQHRCYHQTMADDDFNAALQAAYGPLLRFIRALLGPEAAGDLAEDIAQDVMVAALGARHAFRGRSSLLTWLCSIAKRRVASRGRRSAEAPLLDGCIGPPETEVPDAVTHALQMLPRRYAYAILLHHMHGLSIRDTAQVMGWTPQTTATMLKRGRRRFRAVYRP